MQFQPVQIRGATIQVWDRDALVVEEARPIFPWVVVCETHRSSWGSMTLEGIEQMRDEPEGWCVECRRSVDELIGGPLAPLAQPTTGDHEYLSKSRVTRMRRKAALRLPFKGSGASKLSRAAPTGERAGEAHITCGYTWTDLVYATAALQWYRRCPTPSKDAIHETTRTHLRNWGLSYRQRPEWKEIPDDLWPIARRYTEEVFGPQMHEDWRRLEWSA